MKHTTDTLGLGINTVIEAVAAVGVELSTDQASLIVRHAELVVHANTTMNLTRITAAEDVLALHIVDSLGFLPFVGDIVGRVVDLGSGAGYPGIPLAILGFDVTLCESIKKKAAFLSEIIGALGLEARVEPKRAEELAASSPESADVVIARAVSSLPSLIELAAPILARGGRLIALKGVPSDAELKSASSASTLCGMREIQRRQYALPTGESRTVLVFEKVSRPRVSLPRRPGMAQRQPLA